MSRSRRRPKQTRRDIDGRLARRATALAKYFRTHRDDREESPRTYAPDQHPRHD